MLEYISLGMGLAFSAAIQPGPLQAFLFSRVASTGWKRTLPACFSPLLSDIPIAALVLLVIGRLPIVMQQYLRVAGGFLLLYLAWTAIRQLQHSSGSSSEKPDSAPKTFFQAVLVNVLNPNPYIGWALVLGPAVIRAWHQHPATAVMLLASFYGTMIVTLTATVFLFATARFLSGSVQHAMVGLSALGLAALGIYQLVINIFP